MVLISCKEGVLGGRTGVDGPSAVTPSMAASVSPPTSAASAGGGDDGAAVAVALALLARGVRMDCMAAALMLEPVRAAAIASEIRKLARSSDANDESV